MTKIRNFMIFLDLDGVLADFDRSVKEITGLYPKEHESDSKMWKTLAKQPNFFGNLPLMDDAMELWNFTRIYNPVILTGTPRGNWAGKQKSEWCYHVLNTTNVITCFASEKPQKALEVTPQGYTPVLVDDREKNMKKWDEIGGVFILHEDTNSTISKLKMNLDI